MRRYISRRSQFGLGRQQGAGLPPVAVGAIAGVVSGVTIGVVTHYAAKLAARYAGPLALGNGVLVGGTIGYLAGSYYAERNR
jgi:hypothetical protein